MNVQNRPPKDSSAKAKRKLSQIVGLAIGSLITAGILTLLGLAVFHALIVETQNEINTLQGQLDEAKEEKRNLENNLAETISPENIVDKAKKDLGMIVPTTLIYVPKEG